jgi:hypothetical protein
MDVPQKGAVRGHRDGCLETVKFNARRAPYYAGLEQILDLGFEPVDYLHHFPAFVGHVTLWRALTLYELYKKTLGLPGHIADVGVHKGASALLFTKLLQIFEPEAFTMVHGFDWFRGMHGSAEEPLYLPGEVREDETRVRRLVELQGLENVLKIHKLDLATELDDFFAKHAHLRFKLIFLDCGIYDVVTSAIRNFWPRLLPGGLMVFDQFNNELAPGETRAISELLPNEKIETIPNSWMPNAFIQKK